MGRFVDMENDYKTMDLNFMESVWWVFSQLWERGLIYCGKKVVPYSWRLSTPLSNFEANQNYKDIQDPAITLLFPLVDGPWSGNTALAVWTTTPWTLPANQALAIQKDNNKVSYARFKLANQIGKITHVILSVSCASKYNISEVSEYIPNDQLIGCRYLPPFEVFKGNHSFQVLDGSKFVSPTEGTGIVHLAPAFGEDDFFLCQEYRIEPFDPTDNNGKFTETIAQDQDLKSLVGKPVLEKDKSKSQVDTEIIKVLRRKSLLLQEDVLQHSYPFCERSDTPLIYKAISSWFVDVDKIKAQMIANNEKIHWVPNHVGAGRFSNWLENARNWCISRNRFWGTPLPVWVCTNCNHTVVLGSVGELEALAGTKFDDIHKHFVDRADFDCEVCRNQKTMKRVSEVFDCWFESGSMPYAQNHYPFDADKKDYVERNLPAHFIAEGLDQTRGWFYTLHVLSTALFDRPAFQNVIVNGLILAADGKKMSKRLKNYPDPMEVIERYGADALRSYLISGPAVHAEPMRFGKDKNDLQGLAVKEMSKQAILPLWNAYNFLVTYARADGWSPTQETLRARPPSPLDRWILSRVQGFVEEMREAYESYSLSFILPAWVEMCDDLNNWYLRRSRRRFWKSENDSDKNNAYATLYRVLVTLIKAMAPVFPFLCEWLYQQLVVYPKISSVDSLHLEDFPTVEESLRDKDLENLVSFSRKVVNLGMALRESKKIGVRQPLRNLIVSSADPLVSVSLSTFECEVLEELNIKSLRVLKSDHNKTVTAKPNFKALGKRLGGQMQSVASAIASLDEATLHSILAGNTIEILGHVLGPQDFVFRKESRSENSQTDGDLTVEIDFLIDSDLEKEGIARELINRFQILRKEKGFNVSDRVYFFLSFPEDGKVGQTLQTKELVSLVKRETLALDIIFKEDVEPTTKIKGEAVGIEVQK